MRLSALKIKVDNYKLVSFEVTPRNKVMTVNISQRSYHELYRGRATSVIFDYTQLNLVFVSVTEGCPHHYQNNNSITGLEFYSSYNQI